MRLDIVINGYERIAPRDLYWLLPEDLQTPKIPILGNFPLIVKYGTSDEVIPFGEKLQKYFRSMNVSGTDFESIERDDKVFEDMQDIKNTGKVRTAHNWITGERPEAGDPPLDMTIGCGANVVAGERILSDGVDKAGFPKFTPILKLETIDPDNLIPPHLLPIWLKHHVVTITTAQLDGVNKRNPPPQMGTRTLPPYLPSYAPLIGRSLYYPMSKVSKVSKGAPIPNPYWPIWLPEKWGVIP